MRGNNAVVVLAEILRSAVNFADLPKDSRDRLDSGTVSLATLETAVRHTMLQRCSCHSSLYPESPVAIKIGFAAVLSHPDQDPLQEGRKELQREKRMYDSLWATIDSQKIEMDLPQFPRVLPLQPNVIKQLPSQLRDNHLVMQRLEGISLEELLTLQLSATDLWRRRVNVLLDPATGAKQKMPFGSFVIALLATGMYQLHSHNLAHCDLNPGNVLLPISSFPSEFSTVAPRRNGAAYKEYILTELGPHSLMLIDVSFMETVCATDRKTDAHLT